MWCWLPRSRFPAIGSGSDFAPFLGKAGVTVMDLKYVWVLPYQSIFFSLPQCVVRVWVNVPHEHLHLHNRTSWAVYNCHRCVIVHCIPDCPWISILWFRYAIDNNIIAFKGTTLTYGSAVTRSTIQSMRRCTTWRHWWIQNSRCSICVHDCTSNSQYNFCNICLHVNKRHPM